MLLSLSLLLLLLLMLMLLGTRKEGVLARGEWVGSWVPWCLSVLCPCSVSL